MEKRAAIDIGSNTVQLMVAESGKNHFRPYLHELRTTRLGLSPVQGQLAPERIADTLRVLLEYRQILAEQSVQRLRVFATSAVRDAQNRHELIDAVLRECAWPVKVLSGAEEAHYAFWGAAGPALAEGNQPLLLIDIGGGSTEVIRYQGGALETLSADIGAVRAVANAWSPQDIAARVADAFPFPVEQYAERTIGVGGTITTAAALLLELDEYRRSAVEGYRLTVLDVRRLLARLQPLSLAQRCALSPILVPRGEIIYEGLSILEALLVQLKLNELSVSGGGVLDGCLLDWLRQEPVQ